MQLAGMHAVVTGSTSGIGLAIAQKLASQGCSIALNSRSPMRDDIQTLCDEMDALSNTKNMYVQADISQPEQITDMLNTVNAQFGKVDILVNNAGVQFTAPIEDFPDEKWAAILNINLSAAFYTIKTVLPGMQQRNYGRIVNIASAHGLVGSPHKAAYVAAKHGLVGLTKVVALEAAEYNITCNAVCPGWVDTPLVRKQIQDRAQANGSSEAAETRNLIGEKQPNMRFTQPEQIGDAVLYLSGENACSITGTTLSIDGGWTAI